ncbi:MAG: hypothetical protein ACRDQ7_12775, partial [Haloechinothrix sp.]
MTQPPPGTPDRRPLPFSPIIAVTIGVAAVLVSVLAVVFLVVVNGDEDAADTGNQNPPVAGSGT